MAIISGAINRLRSVFVGSRDNKFDTPANRSLVFNEFLRLAILREGCRYDVYTDTMGHLTVGIGHLVSPEDELQSGFVVSQNRVSEFFEVDSHAALEAAWTQAKAAGITSVAFMPYLASVNYQLGAYWTYTFRETWELILAGKYADAALGLDATLWAKQTPIRVNDFKVALMNLPKKGTALTA